MADIKLSEIKLKRINATLVATNQDILKLGEPIAIKQADGSFTLKIGDGVNKIKDLKSISESELAEYVKTTTFNAHANSTSNPHSVTKEQVGLGNVDNTSDANKPISTATQTALDNKLNKVAATGALLYYNFDKELTDDVINIKGSTITLDNNETASTFSISLPKATESSIGLMSKEDKTKLNGINLSLYQLMSNLVTTFQTTPDDTHYISEKLAKDSLDKKQDKLPAYTLDRYLKVVENVTTGELELSWQSPSVAASSILGQYFTGDSHFSTMAKVQAGFNDPKDAVSGEYTTYWKLLNHDDNYYQWQRTDDKPRFAMVLGDVLFSSTLVSKDMIFDDNHSSVTDNNHSHEGNDYELLSNKSGLYQWECSDMTGYTQTSKKQAYVGMIIVSTTLDTLAKVQSAYRGNDSGSTNDFVLLSDDNGVYQWECKYSDNHEKLPSYVGMIILSTTLTNEGNVTSTYGGTGWTALHDATETNVFQWERTA